MKKNHYRVILFKAVDVAEKMAILACLSNGKEGENKVSLENLEGIFKENNMKYPSLTKGLQCSIAGTALTVDETIGENPTCVLCIEQIELLELNPVLNYAENEN